MKCQFILAVWIICLSCQIYGKPLTDLVVAKDPQPDTSHPNNGNLADELEYDDEFEPAEDGGEILDDTVDTDQNSPGGDAKSSEEPTESAEKPTAEAFPAKPEAQASTPDGPKDAEKIAPSEDKEQDETQAADETNIPETSPGKIESGGKSPKATNSESKTETPSESVKEPQKTATDNSPQQLEENPKSNSPEKLPIEQNKDADKAPKATPEKEKEKAKAPTVVKGSSLKPSPDTTKPEKKATGPSTKPKQQSPAEKSKWSKVKDNMSLLANPKNTNQKVKGNLSQTQPGQKRKVSPTPETAPIHENVTEYVGSISQLLTSIGKRMDAFEDVNKKSKPADRGVRSRSVGVSARSVAPRLGAKSLPVAEQRGPSQEQSHDSDGRGISRVVSPFRAKMTEKSQKPQNLPPPKTIVKTAKALVSPTATSGTEDYEKFLARRGQLLDELEAPKPAVATKSLPQRLTKMSGTFESIASQLDNNIKSVSAVNKDRRATKAPVKINSRATPGTDIDDDDETSVEGRGGDPCPCYNKYSAMNMVRRTAKKVVRVIRNGTNAVYDGVDASIAKTKDIKDAFKNDIIDPAVQMIPVVAPLVGGVVDAGDAAADGALNVSRDAVQGGRGLNDGLYERVENVLKKDKTCRC